MPFTIDLAKLGNVNLIGEALRDYAFLPNGGYGGYSSYELRPEFTPVDPQSDLGRRMLKRLVDENPDEIVASLHSNGEIHVGWFSDGDVVLLFMWNDVAIINTDAKKDDHWHLQLPARLVNPYAVDRHSGHDPLAALHHPEDGAVNACLLAVSELLDLDKFESEEERAMNLIEDFARIATLSDDPVAEIDRIARREIAHLDRLITRYPRARDIRRFAAARELYAYALDHDARRAKARDERSSTPASSEAAPTPEQAAALRCIAIAKEALASDGASFPEVERRILEAFGLIDADVARAIDAASDKPADEIAISVGGAA